MTVDELERAHRAQLYGLGYQHGRRLAQDDPMHDRERELKLGVLLAGRKGRAFALGELRGYRQAAGLPEPLYGHRLREPDGVRYLGGGNYGATDR